MPETGEHCEVELDPCSSRPCQRGGVCLPSADYTYFTCRCPAGWQGLCLSVAMSVLKSVKYELL